MEVGSAKQSRYEDLDADASTCHSVTPDRSIEFVASGIDEFISTPGNEIEMTAAAITGIMPDDTFTVDQAVNSLGFGFFQIKLTLITGLFWMADSMEMMILSILSPALSCDWGISSWQQASITTVVFTGMMLSATFWGIMSDRFGRKMSFWALGACFEVFLALLVMPTLGWRWLLALSSLPLLLFVFVCPTLPESARFHAASGNVEKALSTLEQVAKQNGKSMLLGRLILDDVQNIKRGRIRDLLIPDLRRTTLLLWVIWLTSAFCYYGVVLMTTEIFSVDNPCFGTSKEEIVEQLTCHVKCKTLNTTDYVNLLWTTLAEFPGIFITIFVIEKLGRRKTIVMEFLLFTASLLLLLFCLKSRNMITVFIFISRGLISGVFQAAYVYTPEVYPTTLRAIGLGTSSAIARVGGMATPFAAQVLLQNSVHATVIVYACAGLVAAVAAAFLPIETKGRELKEFHR